MMGPTKLTKIRENVRKSFKKTDAQLLAWFNREIAARTEQPKPAPAELEGLRLLRDALKNEAAPKARRRRVPTTKK